MNATQIATALFTWLLANKATVATWAGVVGTVGMGIMQVIGGNTAGGMASIFMGLGAGGIHVNLFGSDTPSVSK